MSIRESGKHYTEKTYHGRVSFKAKMREMLLGARTDVLGQTAGAPFYQDFFGQSLKTVLTYPSVGEGDHRKVYQIIYVCPDDATDTVVLGAMRELTLPNAPIIYDVSTEALVGTVSPEDVLDIQQAYQDGIGRAEVMLSFSRPLGEGKRKVGLAREEE